MKKLVPHSKFIAAVGLSALLASLGLIGGLVVQVVKQDLVLFLPLLVALPAVNAMAGDYATLTAAHLGDPENYTDRTKQLLKALLLSLPISCAGVIAISLGAAYLKGFAMDTPIVLSFVYQISITLYAVTGLVFLAIYITNKLLIALDANVDDTLIPIANTLASTVTLIAFALIANELI